MRSITVSMSLCIALAMLFAAPASAEPQFIYGIHDFGANGVPVSYVDMETKGVKGWVVIAKEIGHNPNVPSDFDFRGLQKRGYTPICRLDNCYCCNVTCPNGWDGTLPPVQYYRGFAKCVQNFVRNSPGCHIWIIGNEPNVEKEWPGYIPGDPPTYGEPITHDNYVTAYLLCWHAIKDMPEHAYDLVLPAAVCTWCSPYDGSYDGKNPPNQRPDLGIEPFDEYFVNMLNDIVAASDISKISGIPIHVYTHGSDIDLITDGTTCAIATDWPWYDDIYYHFQVYQNYMDLIPYSLNTKPVYITEAGQIEAEGVGTGWADEENYETGYIEAMYDEIDSWNSNNPTQKIRCVALYRWGAAQSEFDLAPNRDYVRNDWRAAMSTSSHMWATTVQQDDAGLGIDTVDQYGFYILPFGEDYYGAYMENTSGYDYYKFYAFAGQTITVSASRPGTLTAPNLYVYIYAPSGGTPKASCTTGTYGRLARYQADSTGWWYALVYSPSGGYVGDYLLGLDINNNRITTTKTGTQVPYANISCSCDTCYGTGYECTKANDASNTTTWRSGTDGSNHWIAYDLGANRAVTAFQVVPSNTANNRLRRFVIQSAESLSGPWADEFYVDNAPRALLDGSFYMTYAYPKALRYVRLVALDTGAANYAEVGSFRVWADTSLLSTGTPTGARVGEWYWPVWADSYYDASHNPFKAFDESTTTYWQSAVTAPPHYLYADVGDYHDYLSPGSWRVVRGFVVKHAQVAGLSSSYNTRDYKIQSGPSFSGSGPWTDECTAVTGNTASITYHKYTTPRQLNHVQLYITNPGTVDNAARITEFEVWGLGPKSAEDFESSPPTFTSTHDDMTAATWQTVTGGHTGNCMQASRTAEGISTGVKTYTVPANTNVTVSVYMKCPPYVDGPYLVETAFKLGTNTAEDYLHNPWSWTIVERFCESGNNGSYGSNWTTYWANVYTASCTTISVGFKHAGFGCTGPTAQWDYLHVE